MLNKTNITKINNWISEGFEKRSKDAPQACGDSFLKAWEILYENAPQAIQDFSLLVEQYNQDENSYDWGGWIWEIGESLGEAGKHQQDCLYHRIEFIEKFKDRFPETSDQELMEYLQRTLIRSHFLLYQDEAGEQAVQEFYKNYDYSVWGYIEWGDTIINRTKKPTKVIYERALAIYKKGLTVKDDEEFMDILRGRVEKVAAKAS